MIVLCRGKRVKARGGSVRDSGRFFSPDHPPPSSRPRIPRRLRVISPWIILREDGSVFLVCYVSAACARMQDSAPLVPSSSFGRASHSEPQGHYMRARRMSSTMVRPRSRAFFSADPPKAVFVAEGMLRTSVPAAVPPDHATPSPR